MRQTHQKPRLLDERVIEGFERRAMLGTIPSSKLEEVIQLRAIVRELIGHLNARDAQEVAV
jgi:hypothetical protein